MNENYEYHVTILQFYFSIINFEKILFEFSLFNFYTETVQAERKHFH